MFQGFFAVQIKKNPDVIFQIKEMVFKLLKHVFHSTVRFYRVLSNKVKQRCWNLLLLLLPSSFYSHVWRRNTERLSLPLLGYVEMIVPQSAHSICVCCLISLRRQSPFHLLPIIWFSNFPLSLEVPSIPTVSLPLLLFSFFHVSNARSCCEVSLWSWKVPFKPKVCAVFTFQPCKMNIGGTKRRKGRLLTRLLKAQELVPSPPFAVLLLLKSLWIKCKRRKSVFFLWWISEALVEKQLCSGFSALLKNEKLVHLLISYQSWRSCTFLTWTNAGVYSSDLHDLKSTYRFRQSRAG